MRSNMMITQQHCGHRQQREQSLPQEGVFLEDEGPGRRKGGQHVQQDLSTAVGVGVHRYLATVTVVLVGGVLLNLMTQESSNIGCRKKGVLFVDGFSVVPKVCWSRMSRASTDESSNGRLHIFAPPGSGYQSAEDETSVLPSTYQPMMGFPGTMRPGMTPENMPFHDLPIGDDDPDPVPWPHFQEHEFHTTIWSQYPPHEHPIPMEEFIDLQGRWATPEMEAAMRAGVRRDVRQRAEQAQAATRETIITDDDEEDDDNLDFADGDKKLAIALGDGIFGKLGSDADKALTAKATIAPDPATTSNKDDDYLAFDDEEDLDDFLLDLGLDADLDLDDSPENTATMDSRIPPPSKLPIIASSSTSKKRASSALPPPPSRFVVGASVSDDDDDDFEDAVEDGLLVDPAALRTLGLDDDDDDDLIESDNSIMAGSGVSTVPLDVFGDGDSINGSNSDGMMEGMEDDIFGEGGFDFGDEFDNDYDGGGDGDYGW